MISWSNTLEPTDNLYEKGKNKLSYTNCHNNPSYQEVTAKRNQFIILEYCIYVTYQLSTTLCLFTMVTVILLWCWLVSKEAELPVFIYKKHLQHDRKQWRYFLSTIVVSIVNYTYFKLTVVYIFTVSHLQLSCFTKESSFITLKHPWSTKSIDWHLLTCANPHINTQACCTARAILSYSYLSYCMCRSSLFKQSS